MAERMAEKLKERAVMTREKCLKKGLKPKS